MLVQPRHSGPYGVAAEEALEFGESAVVSLRREVMAVGRCFCRSGISLPLKLTFLLLICVLTGRPSRSLAENQELTAEEREQDAAIAGAVGDVCVFRGREV